MKVLTSDSSPIEVAWLAADTAGRVGLTFAPGKHDDSLSNPIRWERSLADDLERLIHHHRVGLLVCLLEDHELEFLKIPTLVKEAAQLGLPVRRLPIRDRDVLPTFEPVRVLTREIVTAVRAGTNVVVHCRGGLGRAGTIGGCTLVELGLTADAALEALTVRHRTDCPETHAQRDFIRQYAAGKRHHGPSL